MHNLLVSPLHTESIFSSATFEWWFRCGWNLRVLVRSSGYHGIFVWPASRKSRVLLKFTPCVALSYVVFAFSSNVSCDSCRCHFVLYNVTCLIWVRTCSLCRRASEVLAASRQYIHLFVRVVMPVGMSSCFRTNGFPVRSTRPFELEEHFRSDRLRL